MRWVPFLLLLASCAEVNPSTRQGYTTYRGHTQVTMTVDPKIPDVEPYYPRMRRP